QLRVSPRYVVRDRRFVIKEPQRDAHDRGEKGPRGRAAHAGRYAARRVGDEVMRVHAVLRIAGPERVLVAGGSEGNRDTALRRGSPRQVLRGSHRKRLRYHGRFLWRWES